MLISARLQLIDGISNRVKTPLEDSGCTISGIGTTAGHPRSVQRAMLAIATLRRVHRHTGFQLKSKLAMLLPAIALSNGCALLAEQQERVMANFHDTAPASDQHDRFTKSLYAGVGLGLSRLEPDTSAVDGWNPIDRVNKGGQATIGVDLFKQLSVELHSADLGSAGLSPSGRINYHINGASALLYAGENRHRFLRRGLSAYGRLGYGALHNSPVGIVPFEMINGSHFLLGAGVEYMTRLGLGARAELISFDKDVRYGQLAVIYRLGKQDDPPVRIAEITPEPVVAAAMPQPPITYVPPPTPVYKQDPCAKFNGVLDGVNFHTDSAQLTGSATVILDEVTATLAQCDSVPVVISAHTDSIGTLEYNQDLSERRAESVVDYLDSRGIDRQRLQPMAFGESNPIDSNKTSEGRRRNRRVELIAR